MLIAAGTFLMIEKKDVKQKEDQKKSWFLYAAGSAIFASLTSILGKIGISGVESNLGTAIRTAVVLLMAWVMVFVAGKAGEVRKIPKKRARLYLSVRHRHRRVLAVLLPRAAGRPCQHRCPPSTS